MKSSFWQDSSGPFLRRLILLCAYIFNVTGTQRAAGHRLGAPSGHRYRMKTRYVVHPQVHEIPAGGGTPSRKRVGVNNPSPLKTKKKDMCHRASDLRDPLNTVIFGRVPPNMLSDYQFIQGLRFAAFLSRFCYTAQERLGEAPHKPEELHRRPKQITKKEISPLHSCPFSSSQRLEWRKQHWR